ncbi:MAG: nuclear transport factor 2 family protein [Sphingorhabdus sp.]
MLTPEHMIATVHAYVDAFEKGDPEAVVGLFSEDATVEDPVGTPAKEGHEMIRAFYTGSMQTGAKLHLQGPVRVGANYAAFAFQVRLTWEGNMSTIDVIDIFHFHPNGKVAKMEAYFGPTNFSTVS